MSTICSLIGHSWLAADVVDAADVAAVVDVVAAAVDAGLSPVNRAFSVEGPSEIFPQAPPQATHKIWAGEMTMSDSGLALL